MVREIVKQIRAQIYEIGYLYQTYKKNRNIFYKIIEDDPEQNRIKLSSLFIRGTLNLYLLELIDRPDIVEHLLAVEACYLGIRLGQVLQNVSEQSNTRNSNLNSKFLENRNFLLKKSYSRFEIIAEERGGEICYKNLFTLQQFIRDPRHIVTDADVIVHFSANQAFYLGILAGIKSKLSNIHEISSLPLPSKIIRKHLSLIVSN